ncbi:TPA: phage tail spike protein [Streptococcus pneumoniae]|uniref:phage tail spike protein n=6 Tax=Streptococcus pneumoniae TaxID=1313 RepID=UPI001CCA184B|nr:phage tail spike protein [Streptococcus pneumoniae]MBZ8055184.1 tail fiber domain-containing protein [Streptococcus pneumoniae]HEW4875618.1 tail fiber domain-containing protein [Streptococcus pneumoniae]HEW5190036.1 tail fiber domain-containing protein [Streptococcus pneumoniae]HEW7981671.1 tail fiber domain-containing protein [Streptococcus pneumoniae]HEX1442083.1 tail fiber domain-containing protein [Streptococcus pneumoniae]
MIYLTEGNTPLNEAYNDEIVHLGNNTYQLTFRFPTSDTKWELLKEETFLTADDLHGEQDFYIFEVEKQQGYIQVYANQVISLLNNYIVSSIEVDRVSGTRVLSAFAGSITRANPFSFFSDIDDRHTLNIKDKNAMEVLAKGKHSILGQWGGDMVRNGYNLRLLKNGGSENESLFMYKKNLSSYQHKTSTKSLKTRITFKTTVKGEGENAVDHDYMVVIDSPLLGNYSQIYEDVVEVNDQDVTDEASLIEYGKQYFRTSMCDMLEDNLEISVVGQSDVAVQMFDVVSFYHEWYGLDVRKKITKYTYSPMAKLLKSIGFGTFQSSLANAIGGIVNDAVLNESRNLHQIFEERLKKEIANADRAFDAEFSKREKTITDAIELAKAKAEEVKQELSDTINQRFNSFDNGPLKEAKRKAEEALRNAGASSSLAQESKRIGLDSVARLEAFKSQTTSAQTALSGDLDALKRTIANDIRPKQAQVEVEIAKQVEALSRTKNELDGASTLLAQEAKRIELDSVARLEAFKSQTTSAQTALSGDLDALKRTIANDIRPKQAQAEAEIAKQVEALSRTKNELAGASTLLAQEAKRIELDSVARLEAFKSQTTSAQTALSGDLDVLKRTIANDIRPKQAQAETEIAKQVEALSRTKNELAGVKSAQATYEETTTRRLSELTNLANGKASKSELTQTAEELASRIASVQAGSSRNYFRNSRSRTFTTGGQAVYDYRTFIVPDFWKNSDRFKRDYVRISFDVTFPVALVNDMPAMVHFSAHPWYAYRNLIFKGGTVERQHFEFTIDLSSSSEDYQTNNVFIRFGTNYGFPAGLQVVIENAMLSVGNYFPAYQPAYEDQEDRVSVVESNFKQRANSLDAGVSRLTEGLRTKADISSLNVTAENIRQSVKSLETDTQNKLNQKLSQAEFEVRAGSIRQEILNATKDKANKSELTQTAEELASKIASVQASGRNLFLNSLFKQDIPKTGIWTTSTYTATIDSESKYLGHKALKIIGLNPSGRDGGNPKVTYPALGQFGKVIPGSTTNQDVTISFYAKANKNGIMLRSRLGNIGYKTGNVTLSTEIKRYVVHIPKGWTNESKQTTNEWLFNFNQEGTIWIWMPKFEISDVDTSYSEAPEDIEGQISTVESNFKQRADSLEAGVSRLTEGLRTKADISALNVTAENIRQSVKSLETDTQNKLNQKLSQAEFEVRAGSIRQEILNVTKDKASKSELTQTAEELSSKIASVQVGGINLLRNTASLLIGDRSKGCWMSASGGNGRAISVEVLDPPKKMIKNMIRVIENTNGGNKDLTQLVRLRIGEKYTISCYARIASDSPNANVNLLFRSWANNTDLNRKFQKSISHKNWQKYSFTFTADAIENSIQFGQSGAGIIEICAPKIESGTLATDYSEAPEDIEGQISTVESTFKQRANSLDAGVSRLTEGLRTKVDISALNVTAENIRQSVKSLETDTQNKLNQKLSQAEFEVRAGSIRQEILNATKDKADKTLVVSEAGKLREEFSKMKVGGRNLWIKSKTVGAVIEKLPENHVTGQKECYRLENNSTLTFNLEPDFSSRLYQKVTFSAWIKYENVVQGRNFWNVFNCFKHYLFRKNSETGVQSGPDYATLGMYKGSADWKYITFTYDYSEKTNFDQLKTSLRFNLEGATSGTAWVTGIKVEIGSVATDWSPAPEDADGLITEAKATFERTAQGLRTDLSAIQEYVNKDGQRQEALQRYTREESTRQATAVRELVNRDFVGKATYQEDVKGINQRIEAVKTSANKDIASQIASYRQSVDGKFTDISSQITTYKQDVGGQISGLSNRLTSSEQGTTTQISNISNRINSNKQGTDNQISNLKTQVATNKDNAERQMGRISDQVSANKANADSQFANVTNQLARKVETTDFQRVKETSKLYERILGNTENGIADKVARMALTNQLFQVEVGKVAKGGRNYIRNGQFKNGSKNWLEYQSVNFGLNFNYQHSQNPNNRNRPGLHFYHDSQDVANFFGIQQSFAFDGIRGEKVSVSLLVSKDGGDSNSGLKVALHYIKNKNIIGQEWQNIPSPQITSKYKRFTFTFTLSDDVENLNLMLFGEKGKTINLYVTDVQLERGSVATDYKEAPEDTDEAIRSVQSQLTGSWAVQNINSAGDIISGINLGANGHNRFVGKLTHITGETLIDRAVIKSAMVDKLKTANFEAGSVTTTILEAEAVTAEKLKVDNALIRKLTATDAFIDQLISKRIFSTKVESVISSSTFLEAYQGRIGGFTLGQFDQGGGRWISGVNQFSVGMGNGAGYGVRTAFWANWGNNWNYAGPKAWNVNTDGKMYCRNEVGFYDQVDFSNSSRANFYGNTTFSRSPVFSNGIELGSKDVLGDGWNPKGGRNAVVWWNQVGSGSVKYWMEQKSDRRLKENITDTAVKALDKINRLRMVAFDFIENKKHEEIGLIAQEAETIVPRIVSRDPENPDGYLHIDYTALVPYLIKAIQELNQKIEKMEKTIA